MECYITALKAFNFKINKFKNFKCVKKNQSVLQHFICIQETVIL